MRRAAIRAVVAILFGAVAAACAAAGSRVPAGAAEDGAFAYLVHGDTVSVDEYVRTAAALTGNVRIFSPAPGAPMARAWYRIHLSATGSVDSANLVVESVRTAGAVASQVREWTLRADGGSALVETDHENDRRFAAPGAARAVVLFGPSIAMLESVLLRSRAEDTAVVPIFHLAAAGRVDTATVRWIRPDSAELTIAGATGAYRVDASGRLVSGRALAEDLRAVRLR